MIVSKRKQTMFATTETKVLNGYANKVLLSAEQAEHLLHGFLDAASDAMVVVDEDGTLVLLNAQTEKLFGYRREELLGQPIEMLVPERFRTWHGDRCRAYFTNPQPRSMGTSLELLALHKDGREFPVDVSFSPLPTESGLFVASAFRAMTHYRCLEEELRRRAAELEEADRCTDQFLKTLAHELRSPLATLALWVEVMRRPGVATAMRERAVGVLQRQISHMLRLVDDLQDVTQIRTGEVTLRSERTNLTEIVHQAAEISQSLIEKRRHSFHLLLPPEPLHVWGDATRLVQVLVNLLVNAARYTPVGGHIALSVSREGAVAVIRVKDDGVGIPRDMLTRVFDLFTRLESGKKFSADGLGIGLALIRRLVEAHGGSVQAFSEGEGQGSEFVVRLPLSKEKNSKKNGTEANYAWRGQE
jgi:PAS domain S-box-containing protein